MGQYLGTAGQRLHLPPVGRVSKPAGCGAPSSPFIASMLPERLVSREESPLGAPAGFRFPQNKVKFSPSPTTGVAMESIFTPENLIALLTLTALEIVLGIDNIVFISILADRLPKDQQARGRRTGLALALVTRILLLLSLSWIISLTKPLFTVFSLDISGRDLILLIGGLFLLAKSTIEIHDKLEGKEGHESAKGGVTFASVIIQIGLLDIVFSLDSVITAVGMAKEVYVMIAAVIIAVIIMMWAATPLSKFVNEHPTVKILALSFLLLIGMSLVMEGLNQHISKGYIYFAMGFSVFVEFLNLRIRTRNEPVKLRDPYGKLERGKTKKAG
jgi:predicted tellurium resistance membrane protein TerC